MTRVVLFSGHRVDAPDRPIPRFPVARADRAARAIANACPSDAIWGISSASNGGDILFQDACVAQGVPTHIVLPFAADEFLRRSVATKAEGQWAERFSALWERTPRTQRHVLTVPGDNPYAACNVALVDLADKLGDPMVIALWDGKTGDGIGGTSDLVARAHARKWPVTVIEP